MRCPECGCGLSVIVMDNMPNMPRHTPPVRRKKRKASAWNTFVKTEMPRVMRKHPRFTPQRAMKEVSRRWKSSPKNPNRRRKR